jgi:hypothetical protein
VFTALYGLIPYIKQITFSLEKVKACVTQWNKLKCLRQRMAQTSLPAQMWTMLMVDCVWNVMAQAQKPDFVFRRNGQVHLNRWGRQFSRLLAAEVCASTLVMLDTPCSEVVWRVLATQSVRQFHLHFPSRASPHSISAADALCSSHACQHNFLPIVTEVRSLTLSVFAQISRQAFSTNCC